jgi:UDP-2-acetamido-3-amino-2,3-dideoxy-glucuronate N-acetyltransferase
MIDTTAVLIGDVEIGLGTCIGPFCVLGYPAIEEQCLAEGPVGLNNRPTSSGAKIGSNCILLSHVVVGEGSTIGSGVWIDHHCHVGSSSRIGDGVQIMYGARIYDRVIVGENAWVGGFVCNDAVIEPRCVVLGQLVHRFVDAAEDVPERAPTIRESAFIGMNATVIGGIEVGIGAYIGAGCVLTKSALPGRLYVGAPARDVGPAPRPFKFTRRS